MAWLLLVILLVLLALSIGEASANAPRVPTAPKGQADAFDDDVEPTDLDADELEDLAERAERADGGATDDAAMLDALDANELEAEELEAEELEAEELDVVRERDDLAIDDLAQPSGDSVWPATGATDARAAALARHHSRLGELDISLTWRRTEPIASPRRDEVWLYGTWRR